MKACILTERVEKRNASFAICLRRCCSCMPSIIDHYCRQPWMCSWRTVLLSTSKSGRFVFHNNYWRNTTTFFFWSLSPSLWFSLHPITTADGLRLRTASMLRFPWMQPWRQITVNGRNAKAPRLWEEKRRVQKWKAKTKQSLHRQKVQDALFIFIMGGKLCMEAHMLCLFCAILIFDP